MPKVFKNLFKITLTSFVSYENATEILVWGKTKWFAGINKYVKKERIERNKNKNNVNS